MATFHDVLEHFGGTHESLANALGCSRAAVTMWAGEFPLARAYQVEVLSAGRFKASDLPVRLAPRRTAETLVRRTHEPAAQSVD